MIYSIGLLIREFILPNAYRNFFNNSVYADLFAIIIGGVIVHKLSYYLTGCLYIKGINKTSTGSFIYLVSYIIITFSLIFLSRLVHSIKLFLFLFLLFYLFLCFVFSLLRDKVNFIM